jgi:hypothetical protein
MPGGGGGAETAIECCCIAGPIRYRGHQNDTLPRAQEVFATAMPHKSWLRLCLHRPVSGPDY